MESQLTLISWSLDTNNKKRNLKKRLTLSEVERSRHTEGQSILLFITDRCPVGCNHCSVDSTTESPSITNYELFASIISEICAVSKLTTVGISGGEPFVERRGLILAVDRLCDAGKNVVLYTSGVWAKPVVSKWISHVISKTSCIFLSTDSFHSTAMDDDRFVQAARIIAGEGVWLIIQVLEIPEMIQKAELLMQRAFGTSYRDYAELNLSRPLPYGRGASLFHLGGNKPGKSFGACTILGSPVVRYDGFVTACCNEQVIMGFGPQRLRQRCSSGEEIGEVMRKFAADPLLTVIGNSGVGSMTYHPGFADLASQEFSSICQICWEMQKRAPDLGSSSDRLLAAMSMMS